MPANNKGEFPDAKTLRRSKFEYEHLVPMGSNFKGIEQNAIALVY